MGTGQSHSQWRELARTHWHYYIAVLVLCITLALSEHIRPFRHVLYSASDEELWRYSFPLRNNTVPAWAVPSIAILVPLICVLAFYATHRISTVEAHHAVLCAIICVVFTGIATNFIKVNVGRFRPNFAARCWPDGAIHSFDSDGRPKCVSTALDPLEGMKSFPSGHTAWSTAGLGWLSFWLMGKLECFKPPTPPAMGDSPLRLVISFLPFSLAIWIGTSRLQDYWHHPEDVLAGFILGIVMAYGFYRTNYPALTSVNAGNLLCGPMKRASSTSVDGNLQGDLIV